MLPRIDLPTHEYTLHSTGKTIKYRPFLVGEQEILLQAKPTKSTAIDNKAVLSALTQVLEQCTFNKVDIDSLPLFDVIMLFIKIRARSVDNILKIIYAYDHKDDETGETKEERVVVTIDTDDITIKEYDDHSNIIYIDESKTLGIGMRYPSWKMISEYAAKPSLDFIVSCFDTIFDGDKVVNCDDASKDELKEWYKQLPFKTQSQVDNFFNTIPTVYYSTDIRLKNGTVKTMEYKNINDFFTL